MPVFLSHSFADREATEHLRTRLAELRVDTYDVRAMTVSDSLADQLQAAIEQCQCCIFVASRASLDSGWCKAEIGAFWGAGKKVLIYAIDPQVRDEDLPVQFRGDLWSSESDQLLRSVEKVLFAGSRLNEPNLDGGAVAVLSREGRDRNLNRTITDALRLGGLSDRVKVITDFDALLQDDFQHWNGLFLSMPYRTRLSPGLIGRIVSWTRAGGRLVLCGYELGQWHHESNINQLAAQFGLQFRSDVIVAKTQETQERHQEESPRKQWGTALSFSEIVARAHPIFQDVEELVLTNSCSLYLEPGAVPMVLVAPNAIIELDPENIEYSEKEGQFALAPGEQKFLPQFVDPGRAVLAEGPPPLSGDGAVLALGTWNFRAEGGANDRFVQNLFRWLASKTRDS